ncbi:MAG: TetR/AcrR family transcriptional regulator [Chloroflexi bacterium]|nr:TetR/AcrR family transcriptional regulator [Chloroflexota bacterium]
MPRTEEENQRIREEQREKILNAARKVFARKGRTATMADVAAEAKVSQGLAYRYFDSKEAIFRALVEQAIQANPVTLERVLEIPGTPGERLKFLIAKFVESRREHPESFQLLDQILHDEAMPDDFRELVHKRGLVLQGVLRQLIVEGQASGEVAAGDPDQLIRAIFACLVGLTRQAAYDPEHYLEHFPDAEIILRLLKL